MTPAVRARLGWVLVIFAAGVFVVTAAAAQEDEPQLMELSEEEYALGGQLYATYCARCHGGAGQGGIVLVEEEGLVPALADEPDVGVAYLDLVLRTGRMPPAGTPYDNRAREVVFSDEERRILVQWMVEEFDIGGEIPNPTGRNAQHGRQVYATNCSQCHGSTGQGGIAGGGAYTPPIAGLDRIVVAEAVRVGPFAMPAFSEEQISREELGDLAAFLEAVEQEEATPIGLVELNPVFASGFAALLAVVMLFSLMWIAGRPVLFPDVDGDAGTDGVTRDSPEPPPDVAVPKSGSEDQA